MSLEDDARQLIIDGESAARRASNPLKQKAALQPQYELYIKVLSRSHRPHEELAEDYLRVVRAMRDEHEFAALETVTVGESLSIGRVSRSPLRVLDSYLRRLAETVVLIIERGAGVLTLFALRGGGEPLDTRIALELASKQCVSALLMLMQQQCDDIQMIRRRERITKAFFDRIENAAAALWATCPAAIRSAISESRSVLYLPSAFGDLGAFPLELLRADDGWIGTTRSVARLSSIRTLLELLSPGRMPSKLSARALVVRAQDSNELTVADAEVDAVCQQLVSLGLEVEVDGAPRVDTVRAALDRGFGALHYCGHGFAGKLGESLPLADKEVLGPHDLSGLTGWATPFVYLSTCEVGRARMKTTGGAAGFSTRLIEKGSPAVVGCLDSVPDVVAGSMASAFYKASATMPLGNALATARKECQAYPPACWGAFAYFGDPLLRLTADKGVVQQIRRKTLRWDSLVGRHLAVRSDESRKRLLNAVAESGECAGAREILDTLTSWIAGSFGTNQPKLWNERLELCLTVALVDAVAGCQLRMLLAMEALRGSYCGKHRPDVTLMPEEVAVGLSCAKAVHDTLAWPAFVVESARTGGFGYKPLEMLHMLGEAVGMLDGWQLEEPDAATLLSTAQNFREALLRSP